MSKILRVDMGARTCRFEDVPERYRRLGGRALTSTLVADEVPPLCHPLGPNNKLVFAPGLLSGTNAPSSGRLSVGGKSPLTGTIKEANAGGLASQKIARLGIKAIVVEGEPKDDKFWLLKIDKDGPSMMPADDLCGMGLYNMDRLLWKRFGRGVGIIATGPAGEMRLTNAGISLNDRENGPGRYAGRGGLGAVMGAKGLKAMIIDDRGGPGVKPLHPGAFQRETKKLTQALISHSVTGQALPNYGTAVLINIMNEAGGLPTRNFSAGRFEGASKVSGEVINELAKVRKGAGKVAHPCHPGCVIKCSNVIAKPSGAYHVGCLEYESDWAFGPNCGIDDIDQIAELNRICNDVGLDTIEAGAAIAVAMEGGLLKFGDGPGAIKLLKEVGKGSPLGRILGNGTAFTAQALGVTRVPVVKGQAMPAYDHRAVKGIGVTYATSTMGADHTSGYTIAPEILGVGGKADPFAVNKAELSRNFQATTAYIDSTGYCLFIAFAILDDAEGFDGMYRSVNAMLGADMTADDVVAYGKRVIKTERKFNEAAGFTSAHDRLPEFMKTEPLPPHNTVFDVSDQELDKVYAFEL
ncbi:MAG TPA: aldehyde ferredoxin oxidoreductase C-terminal domain-containing protein [Dehalococcoidia bacterium]|nr:aldehyde ferredoxin oxidoreductase C-terminal domain-containing protein [Dehalococcoidia bacterium]